jgi:putative transposase
LESRHSLRLPGYDYSRPGIYFLTLGTFQRDDLFGQVVDGEMQLNEAGKVVRATWLGLPQRFPNMVLDEMVVMPNHVHGIVIVRTQPWQAFKQRQFMILPM